MTSPYRVRVLGGPESGKSRIAQLLSARDPQVNYLDTDRGAATAMLSGVPLPEPVQGLVLVIDAASDTWPAQLEAVRKLLAQAWTDRIAACEVGDFPVSIALSKCDLLTPVIATSEDRQAAVAAKLSEVKKAFAFWQQEWPAPRFGSLKVSFLASTELASPSPDTAPKRFARSERRSRRRLRRLSFSQLAVVAGLVALAAMLLFLPPSEAKLLARRVQSYQQREGPPAQRLSRLVLQRNKAELQAMRQSSVFSQLSGEQQGFIENRLDEITAYENTIRKFGSVTFGPAEVQTDAEIMALEQSLSSTLLLPGDYEEAWQETEAALLLKKWKADVRLLQSHAAEWIDWYKSLSDEAESLLKSTETSTDWLRRVEELARRTPPKPLSGPIRESTVLAVPRGAALTFDQIVSLDRVEQAKWNWNAVADRLADYGELLGALGQLGHAAILKLPDGDIPWTGAAKLLDDLKNAKLKQNWSTDRFSEPGRTRLRSLLALIESRAEDTVRRHLRELTGGDTLDGWKSRAAVLKADRDFQSWGTLLQQLAQWRNRPDGRTNPAGDLTAFLEQKAWSGAITQLKLSIPIGFRNREVSISGPLTITVIRGDQVKQSLELIANGPLERDDGFQTVRFALPDRTAITLEPGDVLTASLPIKLGEHDAKLEWTRGRSAVFTADRLLNEPMLKTSNTEPATGVRLSLPVAGDSWPTLPRLLP